MAKKSKTQAPNVELLWSKLIGKPRAEDRLAFRNWVLRDELSRLDKEARAHPKQSG